MQEHGRLALRVSAIFVIQLVPIANVKEPGMIGFDRRIKFASRFVTGHEANYGSARE
jgi:hypothetical protein